MPGCASGATLLGSWACVPATYIPTPEINAPTSAAAIGFTATPSFLPLTFGGQGSKRHATPKGARIFEILNEFGPCGTRRGHVSSLVLIFLVVNAPSDDVRHGRTDRE